MTDGGAKDLTASSASPSDLEAEIKRRGKDSQKIKPRKEREARVPEYLPSVDEVVEPEEVAAAPDAWWPLAGIRLAKATVGTIRLQLMKIAAPVHVSVRRVQRVSAKEHLRAGTRANTSAGVRGKGVS